MPEGYARWALSTAVVGEPYSWRAVEHSRILQAVANGSEKVFVVHNADLYERDHLWDLGIIALLAGLELFAVGRGVEPRIDGFYNFDCGCPLDVDVTWTKAWNDWLMDLLI